MRQAITLFILITIGVALMENAHHVGYWTQWPVRIFGGLMVVTATADLVTGSWKALKRLRKGAR